jgi:phosphoadenosine phosphosulfate reductase
VHDQAKLAGWDSWFLEHRVAESLAVIKDIARRSGKPLVLQFSGGRDSMVMLGLVREAGVKDYVAAYMATGLELPNVVQFVRKTCDELGVKLLVSTPAIYKGNLFKRIEQFKSWPGLIATWCCRDLKLRPEKILLRNTFGKGIFYKLEGIRVAESTRRKYLYKAVGEDMIRPDGEHKGSFEVFPILRWTDDDVLNYLEMKGLPTSGLYKEFGVSGCSWCPFYQAEIYYRILQKMPDYQLYRRVIEWEEKLSQPSVNGHIYLRDIKQAVLEGRPCPQSEDEKPARSPCMIMWEGKWVPTCSVYGHTYINGRCFRCNEPEKGLKD